MNGTEITALQRALLEYVATDAEPTWIIVKELDDGHGDRATVEAALNDLKGRGLLEGRRQFAGNPEGRLTDQDDWWLLTEAGWEFLGETPPRNYG